LACDDDDTIRLVLSVCLSAGGHFDVMTVASGEELLARFAMARPELVVLDVLMPGMDGTEALARLRALPGGADVPVVFLSGRDEPAEVERLRSLGAVAVLPKPFDPGLLPGQLAEILESHKSRADAAGTPAGRRRTRRDR
jgi:CheY-like chemotaxis protein